MSDVVYRSEVHVERQRGPMRLAWIPGEKEPVTFGLNGAIAKHYDSPEGSLSGSTPKGSLRTPTRCHARKARRRS